MKLPLFLGLEIKNMASSMLGSGIVMQHNLFSSTDLFNMFLYQHMATLSF